MTSLAAWIGVDSRGPSSLYLASDSRITLPDNRGYRDRGKKLFNSPMTADVFGFCGDVDFPSKVLKKITDQFDSVQVLDCADAAHVRHERFTDYAKSALESYESPIFEGAFTIFHAARDNENMNSRFYVWRLDWSSSAGWQTSGVELPPHSALTLAMGSGEKIVAHYNKTWATALPRTSRSVFSSFCESLRSRRDPRSGGAPQLVGLYRKGPGLCFGVVYGNERFFEGNPVPVAGSRNFEWRNELFERCNGDSLEIMTGAQRQPSPFKSTIVRNG